MEIPFQEGLWPRSGSGNDRRRWIVGIPLRQGDSRFGNFLTEGLRGQYLNIGAPLANPGEHLTRLADLEDSQASSTGLWNNPLSGMPKGFLNRLGCFAPKSELHV